MSEIVSILLPFFGTVLLGLGAAYFRFIKPEHIVGLDRFVFYLALPALFIQLIAATPLSTFGGWSFIGITTFGTYCAFAIAFSIGALINGGHVPEATVQGLVGSYSNTAYLAPALVVATLGSAAAMPMALTYSFDSVILFIIVPLMMALGGTMRTNPAKLVEDIGRGIFLNPLIIATAIGFAVAGSGLRLTGGVNALLSLVGGAAAPVALFVAGASLTLKTVRRTPLEVPILIVVKLIVHPLIVYLLLSWVGGFDRTWLHTAVLIAALPPAADVVQMAERYRVYGERAAGALLLGAAFGAVSVTLTLIILLRDALPVDPFR